MENIVELLNELYELYKDKLQHFSVGFGLIGILEIFSSFSFYNSRGVFFKSKNILNEKNKYVATLFISFLTSSLYELYQLFTRSGNPDVYDILVTVSGSLAYYLCREVYYRYINKVGNFFSWIIRYLKETYRDENNSK